MALCDIPEEAGVDACAPPSAAGLVTRPWNQPNLPHISYRIGTFSSIRRAMLDELPLWLPDWRENEAGPDYATMFVELWAYIGDVLTFYQEMVANEAFMGTATQLDSLRRLSELVGYRPSPGAAAQVLLAFDAAKDATVTVPAGLRVASKPAAGKPSAVFETDAAVEVRVEHNSMPLASMASGNQFAPLNSLEAIQSIRATTGFNQFATELEDVFPGLAPRLLGLRTGPSSAGPPAAVPGTGVVAVVSPANATLPDPTVARRRTVMFAGTNLKLRPGGYVLVFDDVADGRPPRDGILREIVAVTEDRTAHTTAVTWFEDRTRYRTAAPAVYALRAKAAPFGASAPAFSSLPKPVGTDTRVDWDGVGRWLPDSSDARTLFLDRAFEGVTAGSPAAPSFVVLVDTSGFPGTYTTFQVTDVAQVSHVAFAMNARVTRLRLGSDIRERVFVRRATTVLLQSERLALDDRRPLPEALGGERLLLDGMFPDLARGLQAMVVGRLLDATTATASSLTAAEGVVVDDVVVDEASATTTVTVRAPLQNVYARSATALLGNVAPASHGETVRQEILGSGDGAPWQRFSLAKGPLTYVQASGESDSPVESTLDLTVNGVLWREAPSLFDTGPGERAYTVEPDGAGTAAVLFGDTSARPPTGRDNVRARYRRGLGAVGAVDGGTVGRLVDSLPGLKGVTNPLASEGAADPERPDEIRRNAPASLRTMARAVSVDDYANLALTFPGVIMARSRLVLDGVGATPRPAVHLTVAGPDRRPLSADALGRLRRFLDLRRDVNQVLRIVDFTPVFADVEVRVDIDDRYGQQAVLAAARAALSPAPDPGGGVGYFAGLGFGQSVRLSAVYAAVQAVAGVADAVVTRLRRPVVDPRTTVLDTIPVPATAMAVIADDPADTEGQQGKLSVVLGSGGYQD